MASNARLAFTPLTGLPRNPESPVPNVRIAMPDTVWSACSVTVRKEKINPKTAPVRITTTMASPRL